MILIPSFKARDEWYEQVAQSRPPKNKPWYHVLVHKAEHTTYVAEQNLDLKEHPKSIQHRLLIPFSLNLMVHNII